MLIQVQCHCGNVSLSAEYPPTEVTHCNCSICRRYAAAWSYYGLDEVNVSVRSSSPKTYCWGDEDIEFHYCPNCGCVTHYVTTPKCAAKIIAINMRMADKHTLENLPVRYVNGASF
ncbi:aldehyde-activating protein [Grimontia indica]|uniref:GFA family protein n=1 Tax=Grimontia indica TaxID=1056512 RepID=UPI0030844D3E